MDFVANGYDFWFARSDGLSLAERAAFDKSVLFPEPEEANNACCPFRSWSFDATRFDEITDLNAAAQTFAKAHIMPAPLPMLGQDVVLDPEKLVVRGDRIHVLGKESPAPGNFAACWNSGGYPSNCVDVPATATTCSSTSSATPGR